MFEELQANLERRNEHSLRRSLHEMSFNGPHAMRPGGQPLLNLAGNDYLALSQHPKLIEAAVNATQKHGTGAGASRLVCGTHPLHTQAEKQFAAFKHTQGALLFPTGYAANLGLLAALARRGDLIVQDRLNHASLIDAATASGATVRTIAHGTPGHAKLNRLLADHAHKHPHARRLIVTDAVFSMDGDTADPNALLALAEQHNAHLILDEAHSTGVLGQSGAGLAHAVGIAQHPRLLACVSTASKALGSLGGIVTASQVVIDTLVNHARPFIYTTAPPPAQAATLIAALDVIHHEPQRREHLQALSTQLRTALTQRGWPHIAPTSHTTPIIPLHTRTASAALALAQHLQAHGILAIAIRPPTVPPNTARVRLSLRCDLTQADLTQIIDTVGNA
ncbi:MAG: 8-amino-7-oxononanoate synthase [Algisphaera sp.]